MKTHRPNGSTPEAALSDSFSSSAGASRRPLKGRGPAPLALEQRFMFDGAAIATADAVIKTQPQADAASPAPEPAGSAATAPALNDAARANWERTVAEVDRILAGLPNRDNILQILQQSFGSAGTDAATFTARAGDVASALQNGSLGITVELRSGAELKGARAAYAPVGATGQERIYVNADWLNAGIDSATLQRTLVEEIGHALDQRLNSGADSVGDEGELFSKLVMGDTLTQDIRAAIAADNDHSSLVIDGRIIQVEFSAAQEISVPFYEGFIGTKGSNTGQANNVLNFSTLGISRVSFYQYSGTGVFGGTQGNDLSGGLRITLNSGQVLTVAGAINWRETSQGSLLAFGFIPDPAMTPVSFSYGAGHTFTISGTSNFALEKVGVNYSVADGSNVSGNAALSGLLDELNVYLADVRSHDPNGPVTVTALTTNDTTPTLGGGVTLAAGESLSVIVNGVTYTTSNGLSVDGSGNTWSLTIPNGNALANGTYDVTATITNSLGYTLTDTSTAELVVNTALDLPPTITGPGNATGLTSAKTINENTTAVHTFTADESVTWGIMDGEDAAKFSISAGGALVFNAAPDYEAPTDGATSGSNTYIVRIKATDSGNNTVYQTVTVTVANVDDTPPAITGPSGGAGDPASAKTINENTTAVAQLSANEAVTWSIVGGADQAKFSIDANGNLAFNTAPDYETPTDQGDTAGNNTYVVQVRATDGAGNTSVQTITVTVADVNEAALSVTSPMVNENSPYAVFTVSGAAGQSISLALSNGTATGGGTDYGASDSTNLEVSVNGGTTWTSYSSAVTIPVGGAFLVRTPVIDDSISDNGETFTLTATLTGGGTVVGTATLKDNGTGTIYKADGSTDATAVLDDDRAITVTSPTVNENSPYAVFTVSGTAGQSISLALADGTATGNGTDYGASGATNLQVSIDGGTSWTSYSSAVTIPAGGSFLVRTPVIDDTIADNGETFTLTATPTGGSAVLGTATLKDDGTGAIFKADGSTDASATLDDDRAITVNSPEVSEASPYAVFTVTGSAGQVVALALQSGTATLGVDTAPNSLQYFDGAAWVNYSGPVAVPAGGHLLVRTAIVDDSIYEGPETFTLTATPAGGTAATGTATLKDDGSNSNVFRADNTSGTPTADVADNDAANQTVAISSMTKDTGTSPSDFITADGSAGRGVTGTLSAPLGAREVVQVSFDGGSTWQNVPSANVVSAGDGTYTWTAVDSSAHNANWTIKARVYNTDLAQAGQAVSRDVVLDTSVVRPTVLAQTTVETQPTLTGTFDASDAAGGFSVSIDGRTYTLGTDAALTANDNGWTLNLAQAGHTLSVGVYDVVARSVDVAGNVSLDSSARELSVVPVPVPPPEPVKPPVVEPKAPAQPTETVPDQPARGAGNNATSQTTTPPVSEPIAKPVPEDAAGKGQGPRDAAETLTASAVGATRIAVVKADEPALMLFHGVPDQNFDTGSLVRFQLPADAFVHTQENAVVRITAEKTEGGPLPSWLRFDASTGKFEGKAPADAPREISIRVTARDTDGREAATIFRIKLTSDRDERLGGRPGLTQQIRHAAQRPIHLERLAKVERVARVHGAKGAA